MAGSNSTTRSSICRPLQLRHHQIEQHDLRMLVKDQVEPLFGIGGREDRQAFLLQRLATSSRLAGVSSIATSLMVGSMKAF